ncbi:MAG TPA: hypothetical protein DEH06_00485 [Alistipes sp.]|nr:hypothetical protein [Alistipes sp.]
MDLLQGGVAQAQAVGGGDDAVAVDLQQVVAVVDGDEAARAADIGEVHLGGAQAAAVDRLEVGERKERVSLRAARDFEAHGKRRVVGASDVGLSEGGQRAQRLRRPSVE